MFIKLSLVRAKYFTQKNQVILLPLQVLTVKAQLLSFITKYFLCKIFQLRLLALWELKEKIK